MSNYDDVDTGFIKLREALRAINSIVDNTADCSPIIDKIGDIAKEALANARGVL